MSEPPNAWLRSLRKSDLVELADALGVQELQGVSVEGMRRNLLEAELDSFLSANPAHAANPVAAPFYEARARSRPSRSSPVKKDPVAGELRKRRAAAKLAGQAISASPHDRPELPSAVATPNTRALAIAGRRLALPASPGDVARIVDERTHAVRERVSTLFDDFGLKDLTTSPRDVLSSVASIIVSITGFELWHLRPEILANRYAFTIPAIRALGTSDWPVKVPDLCLLWQASFWSPFLLWLMTSVVLPSLDGYYFNLSAVHAQKGGRRRSTRSDFTVDPLAFSIAKALITYVVYQQGATFGGWADQVAVARINSAVYGGWKGVMTGAFISGIASFYDAVLKI